MKSKHVVIYIGNGVFTDNEKKKWKKNAKDQIFKGTREYESDMTQEAFLEFRKDIGFMVDYGSMVVSTVTLEEIKADEQVPPAQEPVKEPVQAPIEPKPTNVGPIVVKPAVQYTPIKK